MKSIAVLLALSMLGADDVGNLIGGSWDKLGLVGALIIAIVVIWRQSEKKNQQKDDAQAQLVVFQKERAEQAAQNAAGYATVVNGNTQALLTLTQQQAAMNKLLEELAHELNKKSGG